MSGGGDILSHVEDLHKPRPSASWRSKQILDAAEICFQANGFHATSMAQVATAAQMSVGLIYRYFNSKNEIIIAIVERDIDLALTEYRALEGDAEDLMSAFLDLLRLQMKRKSEPGHRALCLEIMAEAARNPRAANLLRDIRSLVTSRLGAMLQLAAPGRWSNEIAAHKANLLMALTDSWVFFSLVCQNDHQSDAADKVIAIARCVVEQNY